MRRFGATVVLLALFAFTGAASAADVSSPFCTPRAAPIPVGPAQLVGSQVVPNTGGRLVDVTLEAPALYGRTHTLVLLPKDYDASGSTRYPVLYLLHGALNNYQQWVREGDVISLIDDVTRSAKLPPFIVVMPDGGSWGFYSDWYGTELDGHPSSPPPAWSQYHIGELIPWIDAHYPTIGARTGRAIAGLSMGGFGAMSYAARHPDLFAAAGSFSGAVNPDLDYPYGDAFLTAASLYFDQGHLDQCVWGDMLTQQAHWQANDPTYLASNIGATSLFIASGGGDPANPTGALPNPSDAGNPVDVISTPVEETCFLMSRAFADALDAAGVRHVDSFYGSGAHSMKYWTRDLRAFLPQMAAAWAHPPSAPPARPFAYRSAQPRFSVWGWDFEAHREATEFTYLTNVGRAGLTAVGSGRLDVVTAAIYRPGARYRLVQGGGAEDVTANAAGQLRFTVDLGPPHESQQVAFDPTATASWRKVRVVIKRSR